MNQIDEETFSECATAESLFIYLFIYLLNANQFFICTLQRPPNASMACIDISTQQFANLLLLAGHQ